MGFFDNLLNAVESGALEARLTKVADTVEKASKRVDTTLSNAADKPKAVLDDAEAKKDAAEAAVQEVKAQVTKQIDVLHKKD